MVFRLNTGLLKSFGEVQSSETNTEKVFTFSEQKILLGYQGYKTNDHIHSLSMIEFTTDNSQCYPDPSAEEDITGIVLLASLLGVTVTSIVVIATLAGLCCVSLMGVSVCACCFLCRRRKAGKDLDKVLQ